MPASTQLLRPRDADALRAELRRVRSLAGAPVLFGGEVHEDTLLLTEFLGTRTRALRGLAVRRRAGLGGASVTARKPLSVSDYRDASDITHEYDSAVLGEGLKSLLAVPVVVDGRARAVLYCALREASPIGTRTAHLMIASAGRLAQELTIRDEVDRRVRFHDAHVATARDNPAAAEEVRTVYAELRRLAADATTPPPMRDRLRGLADRLARSEDSMPAAASLTARELDVLAQTALGCSNREAAQRLSLHPETVKSYLRNAAGKLGARSRFEAVTAARRAGLLP